MISWKRVVVSNYLVLTHCKFQVRRNNEIYERVPFNKIMQSARRRDCRKRHNCTLCTSQTMRPQRQTARWFRLTQRQACMVVEIHDKALSDKMQMQADLLLEIVKINKQQEAIKEQYQELHAESDIAIQAWSRGQPTNHLAIREELPAKTVHVYKPPFKGRRQTPRVVCNRKGHFKAQCLSKTVTTIKTTCRWDDYPAFLNAVFLGS